MQSCQAPVKLVPLLTSSKGKEVRLVQFCQVCVKEVPLLTLSRGNEVRLVQSLQASVKLVTQYGFTLVLQPYGGWSQAGATVKVADDELTLGAPPVLVTTTR